MPHFKISNLKIFHRDAQLMIVIQETLSTYFMPGALLHTEDHWNYDIILLIET